MDWAFEPFDIFCDCVRADEPFDPPVSLAQREYIEESGEYHDEYEEGDYDGPEKKRVSPTAKRLRCSITLTTLAADMLCRKQQDVAQELGFKVSTFSKRWKEAAHDRKWPFRALCKIDKELSTVSPGNVLELDRLHKRRQDELVAVQIRKM
jgi:hypothetical protein